MRSFLLNNLCNDNNIHYCILIEIRSEFFDLIHLYVKSQDPFKMSFKLKLCSFVSVPSLFKEEINAFDSFGIE